MKSTGAGVLLVSLMPIIPAFAANAELPTDSKTNNTNTSIFVTFEEPYWYVGARGGFSEFHGACAKNAIDCDDNSMGYGLYGGYQLSDWFAIEAGATNYGTISALYQGGNTKANMSGAELTAKFSYGLTERVALYARLGGAYQYVDRETSWAGDSKPSGWGLTTAVGLDYKLTERLSVRAEYQFVGDANDNRASSDAYFGSLGLTYRFGTVARTTTKNTPATITVNANPVVVPATVTRVLLDSDFDSTSFHDDSNELPPLIEKAKQTQGTVVITGNADSKGAMGYNQTLSEKRAQAVGNHLISKGLNAERIIVRGNGELRPKATNDTAQGRAMNRKTEVEFKSKAYVNTGEPQ
ncbi:outer membrane beta-barrel protein [Shewanella fidelis]|uniref:Outer membrane beta-barrel protein n=1 Tax=Shewanella fidelis TaxID=173509 RepID=A0AAW8NP85_9GAMM|nr:outer membrane beta-barrel protein [Shewanella fidelis]MDR8524331.1 outer membrane beta-barrel protein [Shewanella fidelis]MDW4813460.1 outer membrane beta-barrel protein [Shewanella fidelis]MDW4817617.1 outer membrane beta-barrel protein [Shewanella fidelis]MDW4821684.1 outer membrane beta-barrel protein [Shewanella fidelis]MDW4825849.1 outer membrane beta-barrel protein [Shewanella fidelis]